MINSLQRIIEHHHLLSALHTCLHDLLRGARRSLIPHHHIVALTLLVSSHHIVSAPLGPTAYLVLLHAHKLRDTVVLGLYSLANCSPVRFTFS